LPGDHAGAAGHVQQSLARLEVHQIEQGARPAGEDGGHHVALVDLARRERRLGVRLCAHVLPRLAMLGTAASE
jgi:hypothetical protein